MTLSMPNTRKVIRNQEAKAEQLAAFVKAKAGRSERAKRKAIQAAAAGRPANLATKAREALQARRVQRDLDMIAGRV